MNDILNSFSLTGVASSVAEAMGIEAPAQAQPSLPQLTELVARASSCGKVDRVFLYNPDAIAHWLYQKYTAYFDGVVRHTQLALPLCSVMPSVTPVCFGSLYTGAFPETHGIRRYEKPVIRIDTLFDCVLRAGKKAAIVADHECSVGKIFLERDMDYFYEENEDAINEKAMELLKQDKYDLLVVYNGNYDSVMHKNGTEAEISLLQLRHNVAAFDRFAAYIEEDWKAHDTLIGFAMDHGCHDIDGGCGSHGLDMPEDLNILHHYGVIPKSV